MKRFIMIVTCILVYAFSISAASKIDKLYVQNTTSSFDDMYKTFIDSGSDVVELVKEVVPEKFQYSFLKYSKPELRIWYLAIAARESGWEHMVSYKPNKDGTNDYGPMGLNECNIHNPGFVKQYFPKEYIGDLDVVYMVACINYFKDLYYEFGVSGLYSYNCGRGKYLYGTIPNKTHNYYESVQGYAKEYNARLANIRKNFISYIRYESPLIYVQHTQIVKAKTSTLEIGFLSIAHNTQSFAILEKKVKVPEPEYIIDSGFYHSTLATLYSMLTDNRENV